MDHNPVLALINVTFLSTPLFTLLTMAGLAIAEPTKAQAWDASLQYSFSMPPPAGIEMLAWGHEIAGQIHMPLGGNETHFILLGGLYRVYEGVLAPDLSGLQYSATVSTPQFKLGYHFKKSESNGNKFRGFSLSARGGPGKLSLDGSPSPEGSKQNLPAYGVDLVTHWAPLKSVSNIFIDAGLTLDRLVIKDFRYDGRTFSQRDFEGYLSIKLGLGVSF